MNPPPIRELGTASGFDLELEDRGGLGHDALMQARDQLLDGRAARSRTLALVRANGLEDNPTFKIDIDREKASALGVAPSDVDQSFSIAWGSRYVNNFLDTDGRIKKVFVQADEPFRMNPDDLRLHYVRNAQGAMVPISDVRERQVDLRLRRSWSATTACRPSRSRARPRRATAPARRSPRWSGSPRSCPPASATNGPGCRCRRSCRARRRRCCMRISILVVFLSLAALYESWSIPVAVILVVPLGVLGALAAAFIFGMSNDVYFQVGLLTTIGLSAKNAILIVEFARNLHAEGKSLVDAAIEAAHLRLRPILMTSMAFVLGVLPLAVATGARLREPERHRHRRHRRHAERDVPRDVPDPDVLRGHRQVHGTALAKTPGC